MRAEAPVQAEEIAEAGEAEEPKEPAPAHTTTVRASRPRPRAASTSLITSQDLMAAPRRTAEDALGLVPGFVLVQHGSEGKGHQFFLRGFDAMHGVDLEVTVDGIPLNEMSNVHAQGYLDLGFLLPEVIESVEVTKGPFALDAGAFAMAGAAAYRLGVPEGDRGLRLGYTLGSTGRHRGVVTYSPADGDGRDFLGIEAMHDDGFGENRGIDRATLLGRVRLLDAPGLGTLSLLGAAYLAGFELPGTVREEDVQAGRLGFYDSYDAAARGLSGRALVSLDYAFTKDAHEVRLLAWGAYRHLSLLENFTGFLADPTHGDRRRQRHDAWSLGVTSTWEMTLVDGLVLETGAGARTELVDQAQLHVDTHEIPLATERALFGAQSLFSARAGVAWRPFAGLSLAAGGRLDLAHVAVRDLLDDGAPGGGLLAALSPRVTAAWKALPRLRFFAAYGRGFRPPEARAFSTFSPDRTGLSEEVYDGGEPAMTTGDSVELGARWSPSHLLGVRLAGFGTFLERESVFDHVSGTNLELNGTRRLGGELELRSYPFDWLRLSADLTVVDARFVQSGNPVPLAPWLVGGFRGIVSHESGLRAGLRFLGLAPRPLPHGARGAPFAVLDATLGYHWPGLRLDLEVENVLGSQLREGEYHYASFWPGHAGAGAAPSQLPVIHYVAGAPWNARLTLTALF